MSSPVSAAALLVRELAAEQRYVDRVYACLDAAVLAARRAEAGGHDLFRSDRADWHREEAGTALFERDAFAYQAARRLAVLDAEHEGLVFGRLDLRGDEVRYIGRIGVRDPDYEPLVIDWRAPAAESFYRATPLDPMGVVRRRVLRCQGERVTGIEDDLLDAEAGRYLPVLGEGALMATLERARGPQMRDIVATIQAEQDEAIRAPYQGVTLIAGGPGTGKTIVALHRAAYLLYTHRRRLENGGVLVVGPSAIFMRYIERVLPGLGEDSVVLRSIGHVAADVLGFGSDRDESAEAATIKGGLVMLPLLKRLVALPLLEPAEAQVLRVAVHGEVLTLTPGELAQIRAKVLGAPRAKANDPGPAVAALLDALWVKLAHPEAFPRRDLFDETVAGRPGWRMFLHAWWPTVSPAQALARLASPRVMSQVADGLLDEHAQAVLGDSLRHAAGYAPGLGRPSPAWTIPDMALLDELFTLLGPADVPEDAEPTLFLEGGGDVEEIVTLADLLTDRRDVGAEESPTYAHILVDESQDITPMQWRMLRRRGPQASWTLVGDPAQSSFPDAAQTRAALADLIGHAPHRTFRLSTNYRSPAEVFDLACAYIRDVHPGADLPVSVRHTGTAPVLATSTPQAVFDTLDRLVSGLLGQVEGTIAVVAPPSWFVRLSSSPERLPALADDRVTLITALQAKGMEYDGVVVVSPDDIVQETPGGGRVLYVDLTRATQRLVTLDVTPDAGPGAWRPTDPTAPPQSDPKRVG
ncbi:MAG: AAA family ATPase [Actinomycetia bacterium]|nr:AAA family ATPase [Actinomycetes bacterium]